MKRLVSLALLCTMLFSLVACSGAGDASTTGSTTTTVPRADGIPKDATVSVWMSESFNKIHGSARPPEDKLTTFSLQSAKNEKESCHVSIRIDQEAKDLTFRQIEGKAAGITVELLEEFLVDAGTKDVPDPIIPFDGTFDVEKNKNKNLLIRFAVSKEATAGDYVYKFEMADAAGSVIETFTVNLKVWNITLPDELSCDSATNISKDTISLYELVEVTEAYGPYYKAYYDMCIDYGFSPHDLPYDILDERADAYMSNPRVTGFRIDHSLPDKELTQIYEKLKTNPVWLEKAHFYVFDEPTDTAKLNAAAETAKRVKALCPEIDVLVTFFTNVKCNNQQDQIDFMTDFVDVYCAKSAAWDTDWLADPLNKGYFGDRMDTLKSLGNKVWWYVCWEPVEYCNLFANEAGIRHRQLFWQQYANNVDGFLYWWSNYWTSVLHPSKNAVYSDNPQGVRVYGDGVLLYPGLDFGIQGPVASLRLECIRNGVEDFDLLKLAEQQLGKEWVLEQIEKVSPSLSEFTTSNELFSSVRKDIGDALEKALTSSQ